MKRYRPRCQEEADLALRPIGWTKEASRWNTLGGLNRLRGLASEDPLCVVGRPRCVVEAMPPRRGRTDWKDFELKSPADHEVPSD